MNIAKFLSLLNQVEKILESHYQWLSEILRSDPKASLLFSQLSRDESSHSDNVQFVIRLLRKGRGQFGEVALESDQLQALILRLVEFKNQFPNPTLPEAVQFAISAESDESRLSLSKAAAKSNPEVADLVKSISRLDHRHYQLLVDFALDRDLPISEKAAK